jgi:glucose 1-dehydrogenase
MRLQDRNVLVTGSDQGIGKAIALRLAREGANVVVSHRRSPEQAEEVRAEIAALGRQTAVVQADLSRVGETQGLLAASIQALGSLDVLVNNAGIEIRADFWDVTEDDYRKVIDVNMTGPFFLTQAFVRHLRETGRPGKVINNSSVHEELPFPHFTPYCMSKGGLKMMMRNLSIELAPLGITINNIAPGAIETPINRDLLNQPELKAALEANIPLRRLGKSEDVAGLVAFLASADADYITGATYFIDGGLTWNYSEQ